MADKIKNEHRFCLVFATTLCWARQGSAGKGYKRLVYLLEKTDKEQENAR